MAHWRSVGLFLSGCILATAVSAQTQIGGGTCNSSNLLGNYTITLSGRQVTAAGAVTGVYLANGTLSADGQSSLTITATADGNQSGGTVYTLTGNYSVQANCQGTINITGGGLATLSLALYNQGNAFVVDGTYNGYTISGGGNKQPSNCLLATLSGVYAFSGTGYALTGGAVTGSTDATGLAQFDGQGNVTLNLTAYAGGTPAAFNATGSYSVASTCVGTATLTDNSSNQALLTVSISNVSGADFQMIFADPKFLLLGSGHLAFGS